MDGFSSKEFGRSDPSLFWYPRAADATGPSFVTSTSEYSLMLVSNQKGPVTLF